MSGGLHRYGDTMHTMHEFSLHSCIPQWRKTSSVVSHNGKKHLLLYPTMEENLFHCGIQLKKTCGVVGYNVEDYSALHPTILLCCIYYKEKVILRSGIQCRKSFYEVGYRTPHKLLLWCRIQRKKNSCVVGYNRKNLLAIQRLFSIVSHYGKKTTSFVSQNRGKPSPLYPTTEKDSSFVSHNRKILFHGVLQRQKNFKLK